MSNWSAEDGQVLNARPVAPSVRTGLYVQGSFGEQTWYLCVPAGNTVIMYNLSDREPDRRFVSTSRDSFRQKVLDRGTMVTMKAGDDSTRQYIEEKAERVERMLDTMFLVVPKSDAEAAWDAAARWDVFSVEGCSPPVVHKTNEPHRGFDWMDDQLGVRKRDFALVEWDHDEEEIVRTVEPRWSDDANS